MSDLSVTWSVASERDGVSEKKWDEDDMEATRTVLVLGVDKLDSFIERLKSELAQQVFFKVKQLLTFGLVACMCVCFFKNYMKVLTQRIEKRNVANNKGAAFKQDSQFRSLNWGEVTSYCIYKQGKYYNYKNFKALNDVDFN